jgi:hypothetical protein
MKQSSVASAVLSMPLTVESRAARKLDEIRNYVDLLPGEGQMAVAVAMGELKRWTDTHGVAGDLAMAMFQLERTAEVQPVVQ